MVWLSLDVTDSRHSGSVQPFLGLTAVARFIISTLVRRLVTYFCKNFKLLIGSKQRSCSCKDTRIIPCDIVRLVVLSKSDINVR
jgi:hypothetical protein